MGQEVTYRVDTWSTLFSSTEGDDDAAHDATRLEAALNEAEQGGWSLHTIIPEYRSWDDEGDWKGWNQSLFVFHKD